MTAPDDILARFKTLERARGQWEAHWRALAEVMHWRRDFAAPAGEKGARRNRPIYDSTPMLARRSLSAALVLAVGLAGISPETSKRLFIAVGNALATALSGGSNQ